MLSFHWSTLAVTLLALIVLTKSIKPNQATANLNGFQILLSLAIVAILALRARAQRSLTFAGLVTACALAFPIYLLAFPVGIAFAAFFLVADRATRFGINRKGLQEHQPRSASQVLANGFPVFLFAIIHFLDPSRSYHFYLAALGSIASACADTLASEITPVISSQMPCNILPPWEPLPVGTDGAITVDGTLISFLGGCIPVLPLWALGALNSVQLFQCGLVGLAGSLIDSFLGAALERPRFGVKILGNDDVNLLANLSAGLLALAFSQWNYIQPLSPTA